MRPQAAALKALLDEPRLQVMPGCGDGMGARLIEEAGFRTGFISGSSISAMRLAMPDMDLVSFGEMADAVETCIAAAPNVLWLPMATRLPECAKSSLGSHATLEGTGFEPSVLTRMPRHSEAENRVLL